MKSPNTGLTNTLQSHFRILVTMIQKDILKDVMYVVHWSNTPCDSASRYSVSNKKIIDIETKLEYLQE